MERFSEEDLAGYLNPFEDAARIYEQSLRGEGVSLADAEAGYLVSRKKLQSYLDSFAGQDRDLDLEPTPGAIGHCSERIKVVGRRLDTLKEKVQSQTNLRLVTA